MMLTKRGVYRLQEGGWRKRKDSVKIGLTRKHRSCVESVSVIHRVKQSSHSIGGARHSSMFAPGSRLISSNDSVPAVTPRYRRNSVEVQPHEGRLKSQVPVSKQRFQKFDAQKKRVKRNLFRDNVPVESGAQLSNIQMEYKEERKLEVARSVCLTPSQLPREVQTPKRRNQVNAWLMSQQTNDVRKEMKENGKRNIKNKAMSECRTNNFKLRLPSPEKSDQSLNYEEESPFFQFENQETKPTSIFYQPDVDFNSQITGFNVSRYGVPQSYHVKDDVSEFGPCETIENWQIRSTNDWKRNRDGSNYFGVGVSHNWQDRQNEELSMWQVIGEEDPGMWQANTSNMWQVEATDKWPTKQDVALSMWQDMSDEVPSIWQDRQEEVPNMWQERQDEVPIMWQSYKDDFSTNRHSNDKVLVPSMSEFYHEDDDENTIWPLKQKEDPGFRQTMHDEISGMGRFQEEEYVPGLWEAKKKDDCMWEPRLMW